MGISCKIILTFFSIFFWENAAEKKSFQTLQRFSNTGSVYSSIDKRQVTISINNGNLTGVYEYYDNWNEKYKEFMEISIVYFYGSHINDSTYKIYCITPGNEEVINGVCDFIDNYKTMKIKLEKQPPGYASFDFTKNTKDNQFTFKNSDKFLGVRVVKPKKAFLYNYNGQIFTQRKAYLINGNIALLIDSAKGFSKISYHSSAATKPSLYWIKNEDLYEANPVFWKKPPL